MAQTNPQPIIECEQIPEWRRSKIPYPMDKLEDKNAVVRVASYRRAGVDGCVISNIPARRTSLDNTTTFPFQAPKTSLGLLDRFPLELICEVMRHVDITSLLQLMRTNRRAWNLVTELPDCRFATTFGSQVLVTLITTKLASHFTIKDINIALRTERCQCEAFASFVFLLTLEKCCFHCLKHRNRFNIRAFKRDIVIDKGVRLPKLRMLSWVQHYPWQKTDERQWLWLPGAHDSPPESQTRGVGPGMAATTMPYVNYQNATEPRVSYGVSCSGCRLAVNKYGTDGLEGHEARKLQYSLVNLRSRVYSFDAFLDHFKWCPEAQNLWKASKAGTQVVKVYIRYLESLRVTGWGSAVGVKCKEDETLEWTQLNQESVSERFRKSLSVLS
ncbi:hypothetical protein B0T21DRAFT_114811 [Apiosordaria backusii]|uniref:F-box domain-containing protein n=1 Tax=Apiosordaria backusii TaxID=314023 RepID=A0AA39ZQ76_9PEZI|nr:hypothetical protein B0T21DRAFT_114811 [Apiosordaria backusii]